MIRFDPKTKEMDSCSTTSMGSKHSEKRKPRAFSLRRIFYRGRPNTMAATPKSLRSLRSNSESETRSISSLPSSHVEREQTIHSVSTDDSSSTRINLHSSTGSGYVECPLCLSQQPEDNFPPIMTCHHRSCSDCLRQYLKIEITESRVNIACPECSERFHPNDIKQILEDEHLMDKYEQFMLRRILVSDPDARWCPAPDCGYAVIATGCASCPRLKCERQGCETYFCYHCKQHWHPNQTCDAARAERSTNLVTSSMSYTANQSDIKPCPRCGAFIIKMDDGSCNHMTCAVCGAEFCWLCMKEISDLHYLSPSGCTFWGKKPWSRKKKILWQLGTLVGAPVGIGLVAGIAVPAMIIGIPVWVGRKLHAKYQHAPKHRRNLAITGGVFASILVSPALAGLAVGIGVPILLAYVYGVVPISLCRSGGCGVTTTNSGGVRFEFDDDNDVTVGVSGPYSGGGDAQSVETTNHVTNPSIGPSIGEMSVAMTNSLSASGSHMERVGIIRDEISDRDSASNRAIAGASIAGTSLNGSLSGSAVAGPSGFQHRLEVTADVATNQPQKRASLSSESANFNMDTKSATVSFGDDISTKALAGSICNRDKDNGSNIIPPLEVQVDVNSSKFKKEDHPKGEHEDQKKSIQSARNVYFASNHGSPTSSRSVNFCDEVISHSNRSRRYKRQSLSVGDRIHEHAEKHMGQLGMRKFMEEDPSLDISCPEDKLSPSSLPPSTPCDPLPNSCRTSMSMDSMSAKQRPLYGTAALGLPEVESDRPLQLSMLSHSRSISEDSDSTEMSTRPGSKLSAKFEEESSFLNKGIHRSNRRGSCEMAMKIGRLSPTFTKSKKK